MTTKISQNNFKFNISLLKDIIFFIMFFVSVIGWIRAETIKNTKLQVQVETLTNAVNENTRQLEKINDILIEQQNLNGQIIQFMKMK